jgi:hypothetical protein
MRTGLWKAWFLELFRGDKLPAMPKEPEEMLARTAAYEIRKATWDKTMKVVIV